MSLALLRERKGLPGWILGLIVGVVFGTLIGAVCSFVAPPGILCGWILYGGILIATLVGGYIGFNAPVPDTRAVRMTFALCYAGVMAILVGFLSLFIIVNVRGS